MIPYSKLCAIGFPNSTCSWHLQKAVVLQVRDAERRRAGLGPKCHFFNSFFVNKLFNDAGVYRYANVARWTTQKKLEKQGQASRSSLSFVSPLARSGQVLALDRILNRVPQACLPQLSGLSTHKHILHYIC